MPAAGYAYASCSLAGKFLSLAIACSSSSVIAVNRYESHTINYLCLQSVGVFRVRSLGVRAKRDRSL
ncbi:MAG: hypothetical protein RMY16_28750 [Nostoc sp. DedQUE12b]|uniref:hypothetical protein n=1 Tax=Nostoc sp. DedQUE12b TaxID=3075398 RepID=UPI002AD3ABC6|nr:hypothetical protein [Nostoc sp. DedQUE12b]MDZ8089511.1 hypothetical protein [Nostoc sp. DedQUE12b]